MIIPYNYSYRIHHFKKEDKYGIIIKRDGNVIGYSKKSPLFNSLESAHEAAELEIRMLACKTADFKPHTVNKIVD